MTDLIDTTEMYLRTILDLEEEGIVPMRARISERLGHSGPTVSQTIARMERDGLVVVSDDRHLEFTVDGRNKAIQVMRKHRLAERLLSDVIGLEWELVHEEACRWEHVMSEHVERRLVEILDHPTESPYGNPIPGLTDLGAPAAPAFLEGVSSLREAVAHEPVDATIRRLGEPVQSDVELLTQLKESGIVPGVRARCEQVGEFVRIEAEGSRVALEVSGDVASHLFVSLS